MKIAEKTTSYIVDVLGVSGKMSAAPLSGLPIYLQDSYHFYTAELLGLPCLFMQPLAPGESPAMIEKHCQAVKKAWPHGEVVYLAEAITPQNRQRLIQHKVSFVVPGNQLYLPVLGVDLREHFRKLQRVGNAEAVVSPTAQLVLLWALLKAPLHGINSAQMAERLQCTRVAVARAYDELAVFDWAFIEKTGGNQKALRLKAEGAALWQLVHKHLQSPVRKTRWVLSGAQNISATVAGESALAKYTLMSEPAYPVYAIAAEQWKQIQQSLHLTELKYPEPGCVELLTWRYNPALLAENGCVDRLSLYLSLQHATDPRINKAADELVEQMKW